MNKVTLAGRLFIMGPLSRPLRKFLSVSSNKVSLRSKTAEVEIIWDLIT